jgi:hypothetical protein
VGLGVDIKSQQRILFISTRRQYMTPQNKKYLGIAVAFILVGVFKMYNRGIYLEDGQINWFTILVPFGMGVVGLIYFVVKISRRKKS